MCRIGDESIFFISDYFLLVIVKCESCCPKATSGGFEDGVRRGRRCVGVWSCSVGNASGDVARQESAPEVCVPCGKSLGLALASCERVTTSQLFALTCCGILYYRLMADRDGMVLGRSGVGDYPSPDSTVVLG